MPRVTTYRASRWGVPKRAIGPLFFAFAMFYLGFHAISGERGVFALVTESRRLDTLKAELAEVSAKRQTLEAKVKRLSDGSLDLDMLDERARIVLGLVDKNEVVYFLESSH